jgi:hypothetical protein
MAWDIQVENETGDLVFTPSHDYAGVEAEALLRQRVSLRCKIPRDTYMYAGEDQLGSTLYQVPRNPSQAQEEDAYAAVTDALSPMSSEIDVQTIQLSKTDNNSLQVEIGFVPILTDPDVPTIDNAALPDSDSVSVAIAQE